MTKVEVMEMLKTIKDISIDDCDDQIDVTIEDFEGFDDDWSEILKEVDDSVIAMEEWLAAHCNKQEHDFYSEYEFDDVVVLVGCASMDI